MKPFLFKILMNIYPPYWGTGISVHRIAPDFKEIVVQMKLRWYNVNYVRTHFGGSLYAMTDPFYMLMLIRILGKDYIVWDKSACIDFIKPGKGKVTAHFVLTDPIIEAIKEQTANGQKYFQHLEVDIKDEKDEIVAKVKRVLYIRQKNKYNH